MGMFLSTFLLVAAAEIGDKTQLLTLALAARFPLPVVLGGLLLATLANHSLAVAVGAAAVLAIPMPWIRVAAGLSFVGFGVWTFRGDRLTGREEHPIGTPLMTVTVSIFLAEMGDKTQLATAVLAAGAARVFPVWLGSVLGMVTADSLAVVAGHLLAGRLPERPLKMGTATVFIIVGLFLLYQTV